MTPKTLKNHLEVLKQKTLTERNILTVKHALNKTMKRPITAHDWPGFTQGNEIYEALKPSYKITPEQSEKGLNWLLQKFFKFDGTTRKDKFIKNLTEGELSTLVYCIKNFKSWLFVGFQDYGLNGWSNFQPIYKITGKNGSYVKYSVSQSMFDILNYYNQ